MEKKKGQHVTALSVAQANIPTVIYEDVRKHAEREGFQMATYFRKWMLAGYKEEFKK